MRPSWGKIFKFSAENLKILCARPSTGIDFGSAATYLRSHGLQIDARQAKFLNFKIFGILNFRIFLFLY